MVSAQARCPDCSDESFASWLKNHPYGMGNFRVTLMLVAAQLSGIRSCEDLYGPRRTGPNSEQSDTLKDSYAQSM
jgi:hypothetical protein